MKRLFNYLPLHFVVCVILGIILQFYTSFWSFGFLKLTTLFLSLLFLLVIIKQRFLITLLSFLLFFVIGISTVFVNTDGNYKDFYKYHLKNDNTSILKVNKVLKSSAYHYKYEAEVVQVDTLQTRGKVLLNVSKDSLFKAFKVDDYLFTKQRFLSINKPLNPHQFDYRLYLQKQGIHQQIFLEKQEYQKVEKECFSLIGTSAKFRNRVQDALKKYPFKADELAVINALLLGQRTEISKELITNYSKAGAIHILAVSGLHVGVLMWILSWLLKPLERIRKGKIVKTCVIVVLLWMFAFVAGLSASVVRAVTMFTFLAIGLSFKQKNVVLFSLISSMFFLLIFKPMFLFDVGFQLSYFAVFGIIFIQPKLYELYKSRFWLDKKIWEITSVSIAAQIGVLPLSLYYFHQFPGLFMLSNLVIIPFLGAILIGGIMVIVLALIGILPAFLATTYGAIIRNMNIFVSWISHQEQFLFQEISFSILMLGVIYFLILCCFRFLIKKTAKRLLYLLVALLFVQSAYLYEMHQKQSKREFVVFHKSRNSILGKAEGERLHVYHNLDSVMMAQSNAIRSYKIGEHINTTIKSDIPAMFKFNNQPILIVDSLGLYQVKNLKSPIVILQNSPKINLERLIKRMQPIQIIADGSNYKSYVTRWEKKAVNLKTPFHYTGQNGAFTY